MDNDEDEKLSRKRYNDNQNRTKRYFRILTYGMILVFVLDIVLNNVFFTFNYGILSFIGFNNWFWAILYRMKE